MRSAWRLPAECFSRFKPAATSKHGDAGSTLDGAIPFDASAILHRKKKNSSALLRNHSITVTKQPPQIMNTNIENKVILITGASSGIGEATARHLAREGARVVLGARRADRLEKLVAEISKEGGIAHFQALDVTSLEDTQKFVAFGRETHGRIDVLINNAGVMPLSPLAALKVNEWNQMIDVNIRGVLHGIAAVLPDMKKQGSGQIINLSSIGGHAVVATGAVYCATKFAVIAISEGLRQENTDIRVTVISPGVTTSELADTISHADTAKVIEDFRSVAIPAEAIARAIAYAIEQPDDVDVSEIIVRPTASPY
jgi:NADP-dependent 3-hydroxy acid dehydrogenase YdfG